MAKHIPDNIKVPITMSEKEFTSFALFDTFIHKRRIVSPAIFAAIMCAFGAVCFIFQDRAEFAVVLGFILVVAGLGIPLAYISNFASTARAQAQRLHLEQNPVVYTLYFSNEGIYTVNKKEKTQYSWDQIQKLYTRKKCTYLYTDTNMAYLLPHRLTDMEKLNALFQEKLPKEKLH